VTGDLAEIELFIEARRAEDREVADGLMFACRIPDVMPDFTACGGPAAEGHWKAFDARRMLDDTDAIGAILKAWPDPSGTWTDAQAEAARAIRERLLRHVAGFWRAHRDYRPGWAP
jgi:Family of unknown function (DUF6221)